MFIGIDFGTSNSAVGIVNGDDLHLVPLEHGRESIPTALFFNAEESRIRYGRQAIAEYTDGAEGRLMRSIKSVLGTSLIDEETMVAGRLVGFREIIGLFLRHLRELAEVHASMEVTQAVLGRPVHFVDDDPRRDKLAQEALAAAARGAGFRDVVFQFEPIAAALDYERTLEREEVTLVVDIGGGTSDFSVVRLGPDRRNALDRRRDLLGSGGVHIGGTDFDRRLSMVTAMPLLGLNASGPDGREVPSSTFFDLATWHRINLLYPMKAMHEVNALRIYFGDTTYHDRLMAVLSRRLGHRIAADIEAAKIAVADGGTTSVALDYVEQGLVKVVSAALLKAAIADDVRKVVATAEATVRAAGLDRAQLGTLYFTGGSTGIRFLREAFREAFPAAKFVQGDKFASVARGMAVFAKEDISEPLRDRNNGHLKNIVYRKINRARSNARPASRASGRSGPAYTRAPP